MKRCIFRRAQNVFRTLWQVSFLARFVAGVLDLSKKIKLGFFQEQYTLSDDVFRCFNFQGVLHN